MGVGGLFSFGDCKMVLFEIISKCFSFALLCWGRKEHSILSGLSLIQNIEWNKVEHDGIEWQEAFSIPLIWKEFAVTGECILP